MKSKIITVQHCVTCHLNLKENKTKQKMQKKKIHIFVIHKLMIYGK